MSLLPPRTTPSEDNGRKLWSPSVQTYDEARREAITEQIQQEDFEFAAWEAFGTRNTWTEADEYHAETLVPAV